MIDVSTHTNPLDAFIVGTYTNWRLATKCLRDQCPECNLVLTDYPLEFFNHFI